LSTFQGGELVVSNEFSISRDAFTMYSTPPSGEMIPLHFSRLADDYDWPAFVAANAPASHPAQLLESGTPAAPASGVPTPGTTGQGGTLVGRWQHDTDNVTVEFFADGTGINNERGRTEEFTWSTNDGVLWMTVVQERDFGDFTIRFQQSLDPTIGAETTGYWIQFANRAFASSQNRYRQLDGNLGQIYGRWSGDVSSIRADVAWFEILPGGTGNSFPAAGPTRPNPNPAPFTWRIENGRFIHTTIEESDIDYSLEGDTLTTFDSGNVRRDADTFTRIG